jgi:hypothetical protein
MTPPPARQRVVVAALVILQGALTFVFAGLPVLALARMDSGQGASGLAFLAVGFPLVAVAAGLALAINGRAWPPVLLAELAVGILFLNATLHSEAALGRTVNGLAAVSALALALVLVLARKPLRA